MADLTPERINVQSEEVAYKAAVSEATFTRFGSAVNFINYFQHDRKEFFINGPYQAVVAPDGAHLFLYNAEIIGYCMFNVVAGSGGTTTIDVRKYTASNTGGASMFSTLPSIAASVGNYAFVAESFAPGAVVLENPAGTTKAVFTSLLVDAGDLIVVDITAAQSGAPQNCGIVIFHRPR